MLHYILLFFILHKPVHLLKKGGFRHHYYYDSDSIFLVSFFFSSSSSSSSAKPLVASLNSFKVEPTALPNCGSFLGPKMISATTAITIRLTGPTAIIKVDGNKNVNIIISPFYKFFI